MSTAEILLPVRSARNPGSGQLIRLTAVDPASHRLIARAAGQSQTAVLALSGTADPDPGLMKSPDWSRPAPYGVKASGDVAGRWLRRLDT